MLLYHAQPEAFYLTIAHFRQVPEDLFSSLLFLIILGLGLPQLGVHTVRLHQLLVAALLDDVAVVEDHNVVAELAGGETVADVHRCLVSGDLVKLGVHLCLCNGVQGGGGFVQDDKGWASPPDTSTPFFSKSL